MRWKRDVTLCVLLESLCFQLGIEVYLKKKKKHLPFYFSALLPHFNFPLEKVDIRSVYEDGNK